MSSAAPVLAAAPAPASAEAAVVRNGRASPAAASPAAVSNGHGGGNTTSGSEAPPPPGPEAGVGALVKHHQPEKQGAVLPRTAASPPPAKDFDGGAVGGRAGDNGASQHNGSIAPTAAAVAAAGDAAVPTASTAEGESAPPLPSTTVNPPAIPPSAGTGRPALAEWMKDGGVDDSDADTANSALGGAPSSRGSAVSSAAAVGAAGAVVDGDSPTADGAKPLGGVPGNRRSGGTAGRETLPAAAEVDGGEKKLADWIKEGEVDDSDMDTIASGISPKSTRSTRSPLAAIGASGSRTYGRSEIAAAAAVAAAAAAAAAGTEAAAAATPSSERQQGRTSATGGEAEPAAGGSGDGDGGGCEGPRVEPESASRRGVGVGVAGGEAGAGGDDRSTTTHVFSEPAAGGAGAVAAAPAAAPAPAPAPAAAAQLEEERIEKLRALFDDAARDSDEDGAGAGGAGGGGVTGGGSAVPDRQASVGGGGGNPGEGERSGGGEKERTAPTEGSGPPASAQSDDEPVPASLSPPPPVAVRAVSDISDTVGRAGAAAAVTGTSAGSTERRRWKEGAFLPGGGLRARRSLSIGGLRSSGGSGKEAGLKGGRQGQGWMSDGEEAEGGFSPIGHEIAYIKQRRGSATKGDKPTGGLGSLGAWPNKSKKDTDSAKVIYLGDIDFDAPGEATATDILVRQHRTRVRVKRVKDKASARKKRRTKPKRRIRSGKPLHPEEDEVEYILTIGMMLGLRVAVGRQASPLAKPELTVEDFYQVDKYTFPPSGATGALVTPSHKLGRTFKFKDYAPKVFKKIREHFGVDKMRYMLSVAGNYNFLEFISNAKSGEFFFFSHDERFMIKTMKSSETKFLRRILPHYYEHVKVHPETFLVRFYGMYRVKMHHLNRKVHFIVMNSVLDTYKEIHNTYDLKGSSLGRDAKPGEKVLKDNDLADRQGKLHLGSQREAFLQVARADAEFLARMKIMDYSLLTGIHDRAAAKPKAEEERQQSPRRYSRFFNFADEAENKTTPGFKPAPVAVPGAVAAPGALPPGTTPAPPRASGDGDTAAAAAGGGDGPQPLMEEADASRSSPAAAATAAGEGGVEGGSPAEAASGAGSGPDLSPEARARLVEVPPPASVMSGRTIDSDQAELMYDHASAARHSLDKQKSSAALDSVAEAAAAGELYPFSAEEEGAELDIYSDEEAAGGGLWSGAGTGTEGEGDATDTGGDYTEGDIEYETPAEHLGDTQDPQEKSLSRCSTAKGSLSRLPDAFLSSREASAAVEAAAAGASSVKATTKGGVVSVAGGRVWMGRSRRPGSRPRPEPRLAPPGSGDSCTIKRRLDGGLDSEAGGKRGQDIYFMGIIDILQEYNARKHGETFLKSLAHDRAEISCVDPATYCQRFIDFLERHTD